ncbi:Fur family transcriptional regulator [Gluconobacter wancherniae]|nr:transcriptional repressor [Gluconobacter wancherniae NBRC 103581]
MVVSTKSVDRNPRAGSRRSPASGIVDDSPIARLCVQNGLKMTGQRRVIAHVLSEAEDHPDVEELYRRASALDSRISVATVYRTVRLLEEKGILARRDFGGGRARYEASENGHHYHIIDVDSGRVVEFENDEPVILLTQIAEKLGFDLVSHRIELFARRRGGSRSASSETKAKSDSINTETSGS